MIATIAVVIVAIGVLYLLLELAVRLLMSLYIIGNCLVSYVTPVGLFSDCESSEDRAELRQAAIKGLWWMWKPIWILGFLGSFIYLMLHN